MANTALGMGRASRIAPPSLTRLLAGSGNELEEGLFTRASKDWFEAAA